MSTARPLPTLAMRRRHRLRGEPFLAAVIDDQLVLATGAAGHLVRLHNDHDPIECADPRPARVPAIGRPRQRRTSQHRVGSPGRQHRDRGAGGRPGARQGGTPQRVPSRGGGGARGVRANAHFRFGRPVLGSPETQNPCRPTSHRQRMRSDRSAGVWSAAPRGRHQHHPPDRSGINTKREGRGPWTS